jgi:predicted O-methyltransferase YrrM
LRVHPYDPDDIDKFINSDFLKSIRGNHYDLILVDCLDISAKLRPECFKFAENCIKKGGCIVVDDSWRYPQIPKNHHAKQMREFSSVGPCRAGVTTTDIYFY